VRGAERVGGESLDRIGKGYGDERLGGKVNDDRWPMPLDCRTDRSRIADITDGGSDALGDIGRGKQARLGCWWKRKPAMSQPMRLSQLTSQPPVKPLCPVTNTRTPRRASSNSSKEESTFIGPIYDLAERILITLKRRELAVKCDWKSPVRGSPEIPTGFL
jgi:hypothetical protein